jgi:hypothetical protein
LEKKQTGMRNMIIAHILDASLRFEGEKKAGLRLCRRILQALCRPRSAFPCWIFAIIIVGQI